MFPREHSHQRVLEQLPLPDMDPQKCPQESIPNQHPASPAGPDTPPLPGMDPHKTFQQQYSHQRVLEQLHHLADPQRALLKIHLHKVAAVQLQERCARVRSGESYIREGKVR